MRTDAFWEGVRASVPTALGYVSIGMACGVVGASSGLSPLEMGLMSAIVYGGSAQFAMCALFLAHTPLLGIVVTVFLINLRNFLMSLHATTIFREEPLGQTILIGSFITDESYAVLLNETRRTRDISAQWMHGNNLTGYVTWIVAVTLSTYLGQYIPDPQVWGLDFALVAMFVGIFASQFEALWLSQPVRKILLILVSVTFSYVGLSVLMSESMAVLLATLIGCGVGVMCDGND